MLCFNAVLHWQEWVDSVWAWSLVPSACDCQLVLNWLLIVLLQRLPGWQAVPCRLSPALLELVRFKRSQLYLFLIQRSRRAFYRRWNVDILLNFCCSSSAPSGGGCRVMRWVCMSVCLSVHMNISGTTRPNFAEFLARDVTYTSRAYATMSVSVCLSVTEVHWRIIVNLRFKFWSKFTAHCHRGEGSFQQQHLALC